MKISDDHAICINNGASCCISNCKDDFITFAPSSSTILKGIGSDLSIVGLNEHGDEVALHLHKSLYVPTALMCLLSPQHMAHQTTLSSDGFNSKGPLGISTFGGYQCTIPYNSTNILLILFLASDLSKAPSLISDNLSNTTTAAFLSSTKLPDESNSSLNQYKLLHLHQKLGHLHMN
jgi:hypothetical protein